jgi:hypothetical protein
VAIKVTIEPAHPASKRVDVMGFSLVKPESGTRHFALLLTIA